MFYLIFANSLEVLIGLVSYNSTIIIYFSILNLLYNLIISNFYFKERFLISLSKDSIKGLLFLYLLE